jgi:hypothetical protein
MLERWSSFRNCSELNSTVRSFRRFKRWMRTGIAAAASPKSMRGFRKVIAS